MNQLKEDIKFNCDVSDAKYWGYFSICGLLLRYRDLYRSEKGLKPWTNISRQDIAGWIDEKEGRWPELEQKDFRDLTIGETAYNPFDVAGINQALEPRGLVYGAGYGMYMKPTFFLAQLKETKEVSGLTVHLSGVEYVRDLFTSSAMLQDTRVFLRLEPLVIMLHYKFSELNARRSPMLEDALARYGFSHRNVIDETFERRLEELADRYGEIILHHEIAEFKEEAPGWKDILSAAGDRKNEHYLRALKDLIADTSDHGPLKRIIETRDIAGLGLSLSLMEGFHKLLFPEIRKAYASVTQKGQWSMLETIRQAGYKRFYEARNKVLDAYKTMGDSNDFISAVKTLLPAGNSKKNQPDKKKKFIA